MQKTESRISRYLKFAVVSAVAAMVSKASAAVTFSGSSSFKGTGISASATFSTDGHGDLIVTLDNTFSGDVPDQSHILTAVFFSGANGLTPVANSAVAPAGSKEWNIGNQIVPVDGGSVLGQQWEYLSGITDPYGAADGISSSGFNNIFGKGNFAAKGVALDGSAYGILSAGYNGSTGDGLASQGPYIQDSMTFTLSGFNGNLSSISDVVFQYGTTIGADPSFMGVAPEPNFGPATALSLLLVVGLGGLKYVRQTRA